MKFAHRSPMADSFYIPQLNINAWGTNIDLSCINAMADNICSLYCIYINGGLK